jgi:hypothetical protein
MRLQKDGLIRSFRPRSAQIAPGTFYGAYFAMRQLAPRKTTGYQAHVKECTAV